MFSRIVLRKVLRVPVRFSSAAVDQSKQLLIVEKLTGDDEGKNREIWNLRNFYPNFI
jgi:hypothetical protein